MGATSPGSGDLVFSVSGLLKEHVGATREYDLVDEECQLDKDSIATDLQGHVKFTRTNRGILVVGNVSGEVDLICGRCLTVYRQKVDAELEDEYVSTFDVYSGLPVAMPEDVEGGVDVFLLDRHHLLDMGEAVRQAVLVALPLRPVCKDVCAGLCSQCGKNLNEGPCSCVPESANTPFADLAKLLSDEANE